MWYYPYGIILSFTYPHLTCIGENMKQLEKSAEKAVEREEKLKDKILQIQQKYKAAEGRYVAIYLYSTVWITYIYK